MTEARLQGERCPRRWEAEAIFDGRLGDEGAASFDRHVRGCSICAGELDALRRLDRVVAAQRIEVPSDLEHRRLRAELLRRANEELVVPEAARNGRFLAHSRRVRWAAVATICLGGLAMAARSARHTRSAERANAAESVPSASANSVGLRVPFDVDASVGAQWAVDARGEVSRVSLSDGVASFHVEHLSPPARFLVELPDGEIEVRGTRFSVAVVDGATDHVDVTEGVVELRRDGATALRLLAGQSWSRESTVKTSTSASVGATIASAKSVRAASSSERSAGPAASSDRGAGAAFSAAMESFRAGRYVEADSLFARFTVDHAGDARREDAMFLRAVAASRLGHASDARARARAYLAAYPTGFRRAEAAQIAERAD